MKTENSFNEFLARSFLLGMILCLMVFFSGEVRAAAPESGIITSVDTRSGVVTAKLNQTAQTLQFKVADALLLRGLRAG